MELGTNWWAHEWRVSGLDAIFLLWHTHVLPQGEHDHKLLGVYSTEERARSRMEEAKALPGFAESADGFVIDRYVIDEDDWTEGYLTIAV